MEISFNAQESSLADLKKTISFALTMIEQSKADKHFSFNISANDHVYRGGLVGMTTAHTILPEIESPKEETPVEEPKKEKVKKEKKAEAPKETPPTETKTEAPTEKSEYTKQDVADACQKVSTAKSLVAAKEILSKFNSADGSPCKRISDLQVSEYGAFIAKCNEAV